MAKRSTGKPTHAGRKWAMRHYTDGGTADAEVLSSAPPDPGAEDERALLSLMVEHGQQLWAESVDDARKRLRRSLAELPPAAFQLSRGEPAIPTHYAEEHR